MSRTPPIHGVGLFTIVLALLAGGSVLGQGTAPSVEQAARGRLELLGRAIAMYMRYHDGALPPNMRALYDDHLVLELEAFTSPASQTVIESPDQIDALCDYYLTISAGPERPLLLLKEKEGYHNGLALAFYTDQIRLEEPGYPAHLLTPGTSPHPPERSTSGAKTAETRPDPPIERGTGTSTAVTTDDTTKPMKPADRTAVDVDAELRALATQVERLLDEEKPDEAEALLTGALARRAGHPLLLAGQGDVSAWRRNWELASQQYQQAVQQFEADKSNLPPADAALIYAHLAATEFQLGRMANAEDALQKGVALDATRADHFNQLGVVLLELERWDEAESAFRQAIALDTPAAFDRNGRIPDTPGGTRPRAHFRANLAAALLGAGKLLEANLAAEEARSLGLKAHPVFDELRNLPQRE